MLSDGELIAQVICDEDQGAFELLVKKYQGPVRSFFIKMCGGDINLADDLAQETFLNAFRGIKSYRGGSKFLTWLIAIGKNIFYQNLRGEINCDSLAEEMTESYESSQDMSMDIAKCMLKLNDRERMVLTLSFMEGLTQPEVAELMEIPLGTVKTHTMNAKDKLRSMLQEYQAR